MTLIGDVVDHISKPGSEVGVIEPPIFQLEFEASIHSDEKSIFPSLQHETRMSTNDNIMRIIPTGLSQRDY